MLWCENCKEVNETDTSVVCRIETYPVKGEDTTVQANVRVCNRCQQDVFDERLDSANLAQAFDAYRFRHKILSLAEIKSIRESYGITQRSLSALLGLGEVTIHRYENGSLPDEAHNLLLKFIRDPWNMRLLVEENGGRIPPSALRKLTQRLAAQIDQGMGGTHVPLNRRGVVSAKPSVKTA